MKIKHSEEWKEEVVVVRETAYGIIDFTNKPIMCTFKIQICDDEQGWFEWHDVDGEWDVHCEGGLWFDGNELTDFDGVFDLCEPIKKKLMELGYRLD